MKVPNNGVPGIHCALAFMGRPDACITAESVLSSAVKVSSGFGHPMLTSVAFDVGHWY